MGVGGKQAEQLLPLMLSFIISMSLRPVRVSNEGTISKTYIFWLFSVGAAGAHKTYNFCKFHIVCSDLKKILGLRC